MKNNIKLSLPQKLAALIRKLRLKKHRYAHNLFTIEGEKSFLTVYNSEYHIKTVICTEAFFEKNKISLDSSSIIDSIYIISNEELSRLSYFKTSDSVIAIVEIPKQKYEISNKSSLTIALDKISDPGNLGTIIRTADWYGVHDIICSTDTVDIYNPKVIASTMGSFVNVRLYYTNLVEWIANIRNTNKNIIVMAATLEGADIHTAEFDNEGIVIIGNESIGIDKDLIELSDMQITIPKYGKAESLNAAIATGIILDHLVTRIN